MHTRNTSSYTVVLASVQIVSQKCLWLIAHQWHRLVRLYLETVRDLSLLKYITKECHGIYNQRHVVDCLLKCVYIVMITKRALNLYQTTISDLVVLLNAIESFPYIVAD